MNILFLSQIVPYPPHGGVLQRGYNLLREISKYNNVHLLAFIHPDILKTTEEVEAARKELKKYCEDVEFFNLWVKESNLKKYCGLSKSLLSSLPFSVHAHRSKTFKERVAQLVKKNNFDVVHYDTLSLCQFDENQKKNCRVLTHHNIESKLMERRSRFEKNACIRFYLSLQAKRLKNLEKAEIGKFEQNIVMSKADEQLLKEINPNINLSIVPNGVDTHYFQCGEEDDVSSLIYTGGMNMFANHDAVLFFFKKIWPKIKEKVPKVRFYAVGQDPPQELVRLGDTIRDIIVTGYVDDIRPLVTAASVYVVPLRIGGGTRLKVLDAMAMGKAIVSTSLGSEGLEVTLGENIIIADNPRYFADKTVELLRNKQKRTQLGGAARKLVETKYGWEAIGKVLQGVYETAAKNAAKGKRFG